MKLSKSIINKFRSNNIFVYLSLIVLYLITRLTNFTTLPIFTDESIYIYWAKYIFTSHSHWFISITDGKPPLLVWIIGIFLNIFPSDMYLIAGRLPSVIFGVIAILGIYKLTLLLFSSRRVAIICSILYIISPFFLLYDRMALFDSMLNSMLIWAVYFSIKTGKELKLKYAVLWGIFLGLAFLSKATAVIFLALTPLVAIIFNNIKSKNKIIRLSKFIIIALVVGEIINNLQRVSSSYFMMELKNQQFQQPLKDLISNPFMLVENNINAIYSWVVGFYTWPLLILGLFSFLILFKSKLRTGLILFILWLFPIVIFAFVGREIYPRYILFIMPYFLIACAYGIYYLFKQHVVLKLIGFFFILIFSFEMVKFDYSLIFNPYSAPLPKSEYSQYVSDHPSGYGLNKVFAFLNQESKNDKITLITQGTFGLYPYAFYLEYWGNPNINIVPVWPLDLNSDQILKLNKIQKTYILFKDYENDLPDDVKVKVNVLLKAEKPGDRYPIFVTELR